ncbi:unnamed protein product [Closterium sp. Yama58-4]|nr:unnamed protein product [Closterium sp. Yama58-4]
MSPQAYLGLVFNWGALLGWAAVHGSLHLPAVLPLYMGGICWTLVYDTIYAHQDKADDITAGVKSTALLFGHRTPLYLSLFSAAAITSLAAAGSAVNLEAPFSTDSVAAVGASQHAPSLWIAAFVQNPILSVPTALDNALMKPFLATRLQSTSVAAFPLLSVGMGWHRSYIAFPLVPHRGVPSCCRVAGPPFYASLAAAGAHMAWQIATTEYDSREDCYSK